MKVSIAVSLASLLVAFVTGCGTPRSEEKSAALPAPSASFNEAGAAGQPSHSVALGSDVVGEITSVNAKGNFVVLGFAVGVLPAPGSSMAVYRNGVKVGQVKVSGPHRDTFTVADILRGECLPGDQVRAF